MNESALFHAYRAAGRGPVAAQVTRLAPDLPGELPSTRIGPPRRPKRPVARIWCPVPRPWTATLAYLRRRGWHVHSIGAVAYAHDPSAPERPGWLMLGRSDYVRPTMAGEL